MILTWAEFLAELKSEFMINDTSDDILLQQLTNESLIQLCASGEHLRDFRVVLDNQLIAAVDFFELSQYQIASIEQIYYERILLGSPRQRWALTENNAPVCPAPIAGFPASYFITETSTSALTPKYRLTFLPRNSAIINDALIWVFIGFKFIVGPATLMPYVGVYPFLKISILERLRIRRNVDPNRVIPLDPLLTRTARAAGAIQDEGDTIADEPPPEHEPSRS